MVCVTGRDQELEGSVIGILAGDGEILALNGLTVLLVYLVTQFIEAVQGVLQLLPQGDHRGGSGPVGGRTRSTTGKAAVIGVGAVERLQLKPDELGRLESECHVGFHGEAKVLDGFTIVKGLALFVRPLQTLLQPLHLVQLFRYCFHVVKVLGKASCFVVAVAAGHLDNTVIRWRKPVATAGGGGGQQVLHYCFT